MSTLYKRKNSPLWHYSSYYQGRRLRRSTKMRQRKLAVQVQNEWDIKLFNGDISFIEKELNSSYNLNVFLDECLSVRSRISSNTQKMASTVVNKFKDYLSLNGIISITEINTRVIDGYIDYLDSSPKTKKNHVIELRQMFKRALSDGLLISNPVDGVTLPRIVKEDIHRCLSESDLKYIFQNPGEWKLYYEFLFRTGLRAGDVAMLQYEDINLSKKAIVSLVRKSRKIHEFALSDVLIGLIKGKGCYGPIFPNLYSENSVCVNSNLKKPREHMQMILELNGQPKATLHSFRTTFNNTLRDLGLELADRQILLAHASSDSTKVYTHPNLQVAQSWVNKLPVFN